MSGPNPQARAADPAISAFVTANAGSGKTKTLTDRVARLLLDGVEPSAILCVTYTKAAAAEMQRRLFEVLGDWSVMADTPLREALRRLPTDRVDDLARARQLFARALETPGGLKIQTLHAFCEKLLRRFPIEAGISPGFSVLDDVEAHGLTAQARASVARHALGQPGPIADAYAHMSVELDFEAFGQMFKRFEARRGYLADHLEREGGLDGAIQAVWRACGFNGATTPEEQAEAAMAIIDRDLWRRTAEVLLAAGGKRNEDFAKILMRVVEAPEPEYVDAASAFLNKDGTPAKWLADATALRSRPELQAFVCAEQDRILAVAERIRAATVGATTAHVLTLADAYLRAYRDLKDLSGKLDFADLVERAKALLDTRPQAAWVLYKLDGGVDHVLVDEAQDTSPDQWAIVQALTAEFFAGAGTRSAADPARQLFVVGDEKQSIYSFQGAQPDLMFQAYESRRRDAESAGAVLERVDLLDSFRSTPEVLRFVDAVFTPAHLTRAIRQRPDAEPVVHVPRRTDHAGCVDLWNLEIQQPSEKRTAWRRPLDVEGEDSAYRRLARRMAGEISDLIRRGDLIYDKALDVDGSRGGWRAAQPQDVLILVRRRGVLFEEILRALKHARLPTAGADRLKLSEHIVFQDLLALARFIQAPRDELTLAALLKSPLCGLNDASLFDLAHDRGEVDLWSMLGRRAAERPAWAAALEVLELARRVSATSTPYETYMRVLAHCGGHGRTLRCALVSRLGEEAEEALNEFLRQVLAAEARGVTEFEALAAALAALDIEVKREMEAPSGQVRVMTVHGAKGLEAPIVFLPDLVQTRGGQASPLLETYEGGVLWSRSQANDCDASARARAERDQRADDETYRQLYVALTRARDRLVLCGRVNAVEAQKLDTLGGWWRALDDAMTGLGETVRQVDHPAGAFRRYGPDPLTMARTGSEVVAPASKPSWIDTPLEAEATARLIAASEGVEVRPAPAPSPLAQIEGLGRFRRGELIHWLLELLPDLAPQARVAAAERLLTREADLTPAHRAEMAAAALAVLNDPRFAEVFGPGSRAEAVVAGTSSRLPPGLGLSGRVDRLVVLPDRVLVADFKTNRPAPARVEDADPAYIRQLALYAAVLGEVFPGRRIEAALVWTDGPKLMTVPENMLAESLAALVRGG